MTDVLEREIGGLTVRIDRRLCVGFGDCVSEAPGVFGLDDEDLAVFMEGSDANGASRERVIAACEACPVDAVTALEPNGKVVAP